MKAKFTNVLVGRACHRSRVASGALSKDEAQRASEALVELKKRYPNQAALAEALGVSQQQVSNALRGKSIGFSIVRGIARLLGKSESEVLNPRDEGADAAYRGKETAAIVVREPSVPYSSALPPAPATLADRVDVIMRLFGGTDEDLAFRLLLPQARIERFLGDLLRRPNGPADAEVLWALAKLAHTNIHFLVTGQGPSGPPMQWIEDRPKAHELPGWKPCASAFLERQPEVSPFAVELAGEIYLPDAAPVGWGMSERVVEALVGVIAALGYPIRRGGSIPQKRLKIGPGSPDGFHWELVENGSHVVWFQVPASARDRVASRLRSLLEVASINRTDVYRAGADVELVRHIDAALSGLVEDRATVSSASHRALEHPGVIEAFASAAELTPVDVVLFVCGLLPRSAVAARIERLRAMARDARDSVTMMQPILLGACEFGGMLALRGLAASLTFIEDSPAEKLKQLTGGDARAHGMSLGNLRMSRFLAEVACALVEHQAPDFVGSWQRAALFSPGPKMDFASDVWLELKKAGHVLE